MTHYLRASALVLAAVLALGAGGGEAAEPGAVVELRQVPVSGRLPVVRPAPPFILERAGGGEVRLADLRGKVVVMAVIYTSCTDTCPLVTGKMAVLQRRLRERKLLGSQVTLLSVSLDPERDTPDVLRRYARAFGAEPGAWLFLRGAPEPTRRLLADYDVWVRPAAREELDHSDRIFLIDPEGRIREIYSQRLFAVASVLEDVLSLFR